MNKITQIRNVTSLSEINPDAIIQTAGSKPLRVLCDDFNIYYCKYHKGAGQAFDLFKEYFASSVLNLLNIMAPDFALVNIKREHIQQTGLPFRYFDRPCFGSLFYQNSKDVDRFLTGIFSGSGEFAGLRESLLKIALFDIWLCNEDRNENNYNLLYDYQRKILIPIDHVNIFNCGNLENDPVLITEEDSILFSSLFNRTFSRILPTKISRIRSEVTDSFVDDVNQCKKILPDILQAAPEEWLLDEAFLTLRLSNLFGDAWIESCIDTFKNFIQISKNHN